MSLGQHPAEQVPNRYGLQGDFRGESLMTPLRSILQITLRHGIWRIRLDGEFFGDYRSKSHALEAANTAQRAMAETGRIAEVAMTPDTSLSRRRRNVAAQARNKH